jgi:hypothetical protein
MNTPLLFKRMKSFFILMLLISTNFISAQTVPSDFWQSFEKNITISELQENYSNALFGDTNTFVLMNHGIEIPSQENYSFQSNIAVNVLDKNIILDQSISEFFVIHEAKINATQVTRTVTVVDNTPPTVVTQNITVNLDANGNASITPQQIDNGSSDDSGVITTLSLDNTNFSCSGLGKNIVTLTASDTYGNTASNQATVTVVDLTAPVITPKDITISLDANGSASIVAADVSSVIDNCTLDTTTIDISNFTCENIGENIVTITAKDASGAGPTGNFTEIIGQLNGSQNTVMTAGDVNNDGFDDVLLTNILYISRGDGTFTPHSLSNGAGGNGGALGDLDGDGDLDIINGNYVYHWNGTGVTYKQQLSVDPIFNSAVLADLDGDGDLDYYKPTYYQNSEKVYFNDGTGMFGNPVEYQIGLYQVTATSGDYDNDGDIDIITGGYYDVYFAKNDGLGNLTFSSVASNGNDYIFKMKSGDFNNDGNLDIAVAYSNSELEIMYGNGDGTFTRIDLVSSEATQYSRSIDVADYDGDGDLDILKINRYNASIWINNGVGNFQETVYTLPSVSYYQDGVFADFNGDGFNDFAISHQGNGVVNISEVSLGNTTTATATVTVVDNIAPTVVSQPISVTLTASGTVSILPTEVLQSGSDNCGAVTYTVSQDTFGAQDAINSPVTIQLTGTDVHGNAQRFLQLLR